MTLETALMLPLLLALVFGSIALILGFDARLVTTDAARNAARTVSIECGIDPSQGNWFPKAVAAAKQNLSAGGLYVNSAPSVADPTGTVQTVPLKNYGDWYISATCSGGVATATVGYAQINLFPPFGAILPFSGGQMGPWLFQLMASATYPVE